MPFVTDKVGYQVGTEPVELGDDPDGMLCMLTHAAARTERGVWHELVF